MNKSEKKLLETHTRDLVVTVEGILGYKIGAGELKKAIGPAPDYSPPSSIPEWGKA